MGKSDKNKAHARRMEAKRLNKAKDDAVAATCRLVLLVMYISLVDEFKFDMKKLSRLRKRMDRYSKYIRDKEQTGINQNLIVELLAKRGIDATKIGDDYIEEMEEKGDASEGIAAYKEETLAREQCESLEKWNYSAEGKEERKRREEAWNE